MISTNLQFLGEMVRYNGGEGGEEGGKEHTDIADVNGDVEEMHYMIEKSCCHHETYGGCMCGCVHGDVCKGMRVGGCLGIHICVRVHA